MKVLNEGSLTVALDSEMTDELLQEGAVRDIIRSIQNLRKEKNLEVTDRITLLIDGSSWLKGAVGEFSDHLLQETLANSFVWGRKDGSTEVECGKERCFINLEKVND